MTDELRSILEETMDHEPPMSTSTDDILTAGRRKQTGRRLGMMGGVAAVAAIVVGATVALSGGGADADPNDADPAGPTVDDAAYPVVETWEEYGQTAADLFAEQGPDFWYENSESVPFEMSEDGMPVGGPDEQETPHVGSAFLRTAEGRPVGSVAVYAYEPGPWTNEPSMDSFPDPWNGSIFSCWSGESEVVQGDDMNAPVKIQVTERTCEQKVTPDGDTMYTVAMVEGYEGEDPESYENQVVVFRADGTAVVVSAFCGSADEDDEFGGTCHDIQFDLDQLEAIALALPKVIVVDDGE